MNKLQLPKVAEFNEKLVTYVDNEGFETSHVRDDITETKLIPSKDGLGFLVLLMKIGTEKRYEFFNSLEDAKLFKRHLDTAI